ncbi:MAG: hypothetical protein ACREJQ_00775, partial [bacterium]
DGSSQPGVSFAAFRGDALVLQGVTDAGGAVPLDRFTTPLTFRFARTPARPEIGNDELVVTNLGPTRIEKARLFASQQAGGFAFASIASVLRTAELRDEGGRLFRQMAVQPPLQAGFVPSLAPFQTDTVVELSEESGRTNSLRVSGHPSWVLLPPLGTAGDRLYYLKAADNTIDIYVKGMSDDTQDVLFSQRVVDSSTFGEVPLPGTLTEWSSRYDAVWVEAGGVRRFWSFPTGQPGYAPMAAGSMYGVSVPAGERRALYRPDGIKILGPGAESAEPLSIEDSAGLWISAETVRNGDLRIVNDFVPVVSGNALDLQWSDDATYYGGTRKILMASAPAALLMLLTDPLFDPVFLQPTLTPPQVISTFRQVETSAVPAYRTGLDPVLVFGIYQFQKGEEVKVEVPSSPGVYRVTALVPQGEGFQIVSRYIRVGEGIFHRERLPAALLPGEGASFEADFLAVTDAPTSVMVQADLPIRVNLNPGQWRAFSRDLPLNEGGPTYSVIGKWSGAATETEAAPLLFSTSTTVVQDLYRGRGDFSFQDLITESLAPSDRDDPSWLLRALYLYAKKDGGFGYLMKTPDSDEDATAWGLLALKQLQARGAAVDGSVLQGIGGFFFAHPAASEFARAALLGSGLSAAPPNSPLFRALQEALKENTSLKDSALQSSSSYLKYALKPPPGGADSGACPMFPEQALRDEIFHLSESAPCRPFKPFLVSIKVTQVSLLVAGHLHLQITAPQRLGTLLLVIRHPRNVSVQRVEGLAAGDEMEALPGELVLLLKDVQARDIDLGANHPFGNLPIAAWSPMADAGYWELSAAGKN